jgi:hypothetical protein
MVYYMDMNRQKQSGFAHVGLILIAVIVLAAIGFATWKVFGGNKDAKDDTPSQVGTPTEDETKDDTPPMELIWQQAENGWRSMQTPPACPDQPMMKMPADINKVTGILYPGQTRGGNYKPHGGFRFDGTANDKVQVTAPVDGFIVRGGSYLAEGEVQYTFDIMHNCGVMYRVGHFRVLPDSLQKLADTWPAPQENDSRTQIVNPAVYVKKGEVLATSVGIVKDKNTFFDWGVYDYRQQNTASQSSAYQQAHAQDKELSWHAVCWFDWLPASDSTKVKSLPAGDPTSGKKSDYCN